MDAGERPNLSERVLPRLFTRAQAASYLNLSASAFDDWVRRGIVPAAIPRTKRWDRHAIDAALDRASDLTISHQKDSIYGSWKKANAGSPAGGSHS